MALATTLPTPILANTGTAVRVFRIYGGSQILVYTTTQKEETYEYVALTKNLATTTSDAASQSGLAEGAVASYSAQEDQRAIGSYKLIKTITYESVTVRTYEDYPA